MNCTTLTSDLIAQPRLWRLSMLVDDAAVTVVARSSVDDAGLITARLPFDDTITSRAKALEEVVYANPLLLSDFGHVDVVVRTDKVTIVPAAAVPDEEAYSAVAALLWPEAEAAVSAVTLPDGYAMVVSIDEGTRRFVARTFNNPPLLPHMAALVRYFALKARRGNTSKIYVYLRPDALDVVALGSQGLMAATTYHCDPKSDDATYYVLALAKQCSFDLDRDELLVCGDGAARAVLLPQLRRFVANAMPLILPLGGMGAASQDVARVPFELLILPLL